MPLTSNALVLIIALALTPCVCHKAPISPAYVTTSGDPGIRRGKSCPRSGSCDKRCTNPRLTLRGGYSWDATVSQMSKGGHIKQVHLNVYTHTNKGRKEPFCFCEDCLSDWFKLIRRFVQIEYALKAVEKGLTVIAVKVINHHPASHKNENAF
jgi:hypothetical protein